MACLYTDYRDGRIYSAGLVCTLSTVAEQYTVRGLSIHCLQWRNNIHAARGLVHTLSTVAEQYTVRGLVHTLSIALLSTVEEKYT